MSTRIRCPGCGSALSVPDRLLGRNVRCPTCQERFTAASDDLHAEEATDRGSDRRDSSEEYDSRQPRRRKQRSGAKRARRSSLLPWILVGGGAVLVLAIVVGVVILTAFGRSDSVSSDPAKVIARSYEPTGQWQEYSSKEGRFSVKFPPGTVSSKTQTNTQPSGDVMLDNAVGIQGSNWVFSVIYSHLPPNVTSRFTADELLEATSQRAATYSPQLKLKSQSKIALGAVHGREFVFEGANETMIFHTYVANGTIYQVKAGGVGVPVTDIRSFLDSFRLLD